MKKYYILLALCALGNIPAHAINLKMPKISKIPAPKIPKTAVTSVSRIKVKYVPKTKVSVPSSVNMNAQLATYGIIRSRLQGTNFYLSRNQVYSLDGTKWFTASEELSWATDAGYFIRPQQDGSLRFSIDADAPAFEFLCWPP